MTKPKLRLGVLASGRGSNLEAIVRACSAKGSDPASTASEKGRLHPAVPESEDRASPVRARGVGASEERSPHGPPQIMAATRAPIIDAAVEVVISDRPQSQALEHARRYRIPAIYLDPKAYSSREDYDEAAVRLLREHRVNLIVLAGYLRLITPRLIGPYKNRIINIHPSLLPSFPGLHAHRQALEWGVRVSGCTVHFVDEAMDHGSIIIQAAVPVLDGDTEETLEARVLEQEHRILPQAIQYLAEDRLELSGRRVTLKSPKPTAAATIVSPMIEIGL